MFPAGTSSIHSVGQEYPWDSNTWVKRTVRFGKLPSQTPSVERDAQSFWSIQRGRPFGEPGSILCGQTRVQGRDPPVFSAGITGKSLITPSSIRHVVGSRKDFEAISPKVFAKT